MKVVVQKVVKAAVEVEGQTIGEINKGFVLLVGVSQDDDESDVDYLARKIAKLRIFEDKDGKMNLSLADVKGSILSISQFTLLANTKKGNRPSFTEAAGAELGETHYQALNQKLRQVCFTVETGQFGAHMAVSLTNDGPVTIIIDSKNK